MSVCEVFANELVVEEVEVYLYIFVSSSGKHSDAVSQNVVCQNLTLTTNVFEDYCSTENFNKKNKNL